MTSEPLTRTFVQSRLQTTQAALHDSIAGRTEAELRAIAATPEWNVIDVLRHLWVWNELCMRCLNDWQGNRDAILALTAKETFNAEMVAARADANLATVLDGIDTVYRAYATALETRSDDELAVRAMAPWGIEMMLLQMIAGELGHDRMHIEQLATLCKG